MLRKIMIAAATVGALGAAVLVPAAASAHGFHGHFRGGPFFGIGIYPGYDANECYVQKRLIMTRYGERLRWVRYCY